MVTPAKTWGRLRASLSTRPSPITVCQAPALLANSVTIDPRGGGVRWRVDGAILIQRRRLAGARAVQREDRGRAERDIQRLRGQQFAADLHLHHGLRAEAHGRGHDGIDLIVGDHQQRRGHAVEEHARTAQRA